jgi:hypothetical protein
MRPAAGTTPYTAATVSAGLASFSLVGNQPIKKIEKSCFFPTLHYGYFSLGKLSPTYYRYSAVLRCANILFWEVKKK